MDSRQRPLVLSLFEAHLPPPAQGGQPEPALDDDGDDDASAALLPQSTSVSTPFWMPSLQVASVGTLVGYSVGKRVGMGVGYLVGAEVRTV